LIGVSGKKEKKYLNDSSLFDESIFRGYEKNAPDGVKCTSERACETTAAQRHARDLTGKK